MEKQLSDILDNLLGLLLLEGSYEVEETKKSFEVGIDTKDAGRLIGFKGESLQSLQLLVNQMLSKKGGEISPAGEFKRVAIDAMGWRKEKEEKLSIQAAEWARNVLESGEKLELEPQMSWQRRIVHEVIGQMVGLETISIGEGRDRHIVIRIKNKESSDKD